MPKIGLASGPSSADGAVPRSVERRASADLEWSDVDLAIEGTVRVGGHLVGAVVDHDWAMHGWQGWEPVTITADGAQRFSTSTASGRGTVTAAASSAANHRVAYLRSDAIWRDGVVTSLVYGPTADWTGTNAQQGHLHRVRRISATTWEGIAVWTSIVGGCDYGYLHANGVRWNGTTLGQATNADAIFGPFGYGDLDYIDHRLQVLGAQRSQPILYANDYRVSRPDLITIGAGDIVDIESMADGTFNENDIAVNSVIDAAAGVVRFVEGTSTNLVAYAAVKAGTITPAGVDVNKRYCPFYLASRVVEGTAASVTVEAKRWRPGEPEPDWGDVRVQRAATTPSSEVPALAIGEGRHGLWTGHFYSSSGGAWGGVQMARAA